MTEKEMIDSDEILQSLEKSFRDNIAPTWYLWGTRFSDKSLNEHCRNRLRILKLVEAQSNG